MSQTIVSSDGEISLKEIIAILKYYFLVVLKKWHIVLAAFLVFNTLFMLKYYFLDKVEYSGSLTVLLNSSGSTSGLTSLLGGFGLATEDGSALDKVKAVIKSQDVFAKALLAPTKLRAKEGMIVNFMTDSMGYKEQWLASKEKLLANFTHVKARSLETCNDSEWRALNYIRESILENNVSFNSNEPGMLKMTITGKNEVIICELLNAIYEESDKYYTITQGGSENSTFKVLQQRRDSINAALSGAQAGIARHADENKGSIFAMDQVPADKMQHDVMFLTAMKVEISKNYELAKINIESKQPYLRSIDLPRTPLEPKFPSKIKNLFIGTFLALFTSIIGILAWSLYKEATEQTPI